MRAQVQPHYASATGSAAKRLYDETHPPPAISISDLNFAHDRDALTLEAVRLTVGQGEFLALIGPNGGGKTTLIRLMLGLLTPQDGTLDIFGKAPAKASSLIGYMPQFSTARLDFPASVLEMVLMGNAKPGIRGGSWSTESIARKAAAGYLELLGLGGMEKQPVAALSGGQRQRALVARALMGSGKALDAILNKDSGPLPFLLLLDEPTASIDPEGKFCFYEFLGRLRGKITIVVVSHDLFMASPFFDRIAFVNKSLTLLENNHLSLENLSLLFGQHLHDCPVADIQHAVKKTR